MYIISVDLKYSNTRKIKFKPQFESNYPVLAPTSSRVWGPYMSQILLLRTSMPFPGCWNTRRCDGQPRPHSLPV